LTDTATPTAGIEGTLATMSLPDLLQWLASNHRSGTLYITCSTVEKRIFFLRGRIVSSQSTDPTEFLGHFLVRNGLITEADLAEGMRRQSGSTALLGRILVESGVVSADDLDHMLELKARETIFDLFTWETGDFRFVDDDLPVREMVPISMEVTDVLLAGLDRQTVWERIRRVFPSGQCVPVSMVPVVDLAATVDDAGQQSILNLVDDRRSIDDIRMETHATEFFVCSTLLSQVDAGRLKIVRPRVLTVKTRGADATAVGLLADAATSHDEGRHQEALCRLRAAVSLEPHDPQIRERAKDCEKRLVDTLRRGGLADAAVPIVAVATADLTRAPLAPEEGFVLSRIDGRADVASLMKISPLPETEALVVLWKLWHNGLIRVERA
jgi:hypothetical protein